MTWELSEMTQRNRETCLFLCLGLIKSRHCGEVWSDKKGAGSNGNKLEETWEGPFVQILLCVLVFSEIRTFLPSGNREGTSGMKVLQTHFRRRSENSFMACFKGAGWEKAREILFASAVCSNAKVPYFRVVCLQPHHSQMFPSSFQTPLASIKHFPHRIIMSEIGLSLIMWFVMAWLIIHALCPNLQESCALTASPVTLGRISRCPFFLDF